MQFAGNVSTNDEQYIPRTTPQRCIGKLYGRFRDTSQDHKETRRKDSSIFKDSREAQPVFQKIEMQLQHGGNSYLRGGCWQRTDSNGTRKDQGSKRMEDADKSKRRGKLPVVCKFLSTLYTKLQPHCQAIKQTKRQERVKMGRGTPKSI